MSASRKGSTSSKRIAHSQDLVPCRMNPWRRILTAAMITVGAVGGCCDRSGDRGRLHRSLRGRLPRAKRRDRQGCIQHANQREVSFDVVAFAVAAVVDEDDFSRQTMLFRRRAFPRPVWPGLFLLLNVGPAPCTPGKKNTSARGEASRRRPSRTPPW